MRPLHILTSIALFLICVLPAQARAQTLEGLTLSAEANIFNYEEDLGAIGHESDGVIYGFGAGYTLRFPKAWFLRLNGHYSQGDSEVSVLGTVAGTTSQKFYQGALEWGRDFGFDGAISVAPFIGVGYRRWEDDSATYTGYDRLVTFWYIPVGLTAYYGMGSNWVISLRGEYQFLVGGAETDSYTSGLELTYDYARGFGVAGELLLRKRFSERFAIEFGPFMRYWSIDWSYADQLGLFDIPPNRTTEVGLVFKINI